jgi:hypothetical protein
LWLPTHRIIFSVTSWKGAADQTEAAVEQKTMPLPIILKGNGKREAAVRAL